VGATGGFMLLGSGMAVAATMGVEF
jgi:hypothetical protein